MSTGSPAGTRVMQRVTRSASLNETRRQQGSVSREPGSGVVVRATTISFTGSATIADSGNGLGRFPVGCKVRVLGSPLNSRLWEVATSAAGSLTVIPAQIQTESAGATITLVREG